MSLPNNATVWLAIQYLDSSSDYRELLPDRTPLGNLSFGPLVLMDDQGVGLGIRCWRAVSRMATRLRSVMPSRSLKGSRQLPHFSSSARQPGWNGAEEGS